MKPLRPLLLAVTLLALFGASEAHAQDVSNPPAQKKRPPPAIGFTITSNMGQDQKPGRPFVTQVVPGSNAARAGLQEGDVLVSINGRPMSELPWFRDRRAGAKYELRVLRDGKERVLTFHYPAAAAPGGTR